METAETPGLRSATGLGPRLPVQAQLSRAGLAHQRAAATHTGLAFLAFFSALTASSWAFRFSASLLACEDKGGDPAVMGGASRGDAGLPGMSLQNRQAFQPGNHIPKVTPRDLGGDRDSPGFSKNVHKRKNLIPAAGHSWCPV